LIIINKSAKIILFPTYILKDIHRFKYKLFNAFCIDMRAHARARVYVCVHIFT